ncbi:MAG: hypothetical protein K9N06_00045 [Candidatus Cloacimonetes bacterium]|nr:hypothetical protein [Candidatus Cloacimonadota bacterium]
MKTRFVKFLLLLILSLFWLSAAAQNQSPAIPNTNPEPLSAAAAGQTAKLIRPQHHVLMPRRQTRLQFNRFQEKIDLDDKLKKSNKLLY